MKLRLSMAATLCVSATLAYAQNPGIVYPAVQPEASKQGAPAPRPAVAASAAASPAVPARAAASAPAPSNVPAVFVDPRRLDVGKDQAKGADGRIESAEAHVRANPPSSGDIPKVSITKKPDGSKVIRAQVPSTVAEAEALVTAQLDAPAIRPGVAAAPANTAAAAGSPSLDVKPLPKWVTGSLDKNSGRNQLIVLPGVTEIVRIARSFPNRFVTPFDSAEVITTDENLTHDGVGGAVIVATSSDKPIGIFIQDKNSDRAIPLVLVPEDVPQRDIRFILDDSWGAPQLRNIPDSANAATMPSAQTDYVEYLKLIMRSLAKGEVPDGHALSPILPELVPNCQSPGLQMRLGQMLEGAKTRIAVYTATNPNQHSVPFQEPGCYRSGVLAVSAFPRPVLESGQDTEVYVVMRKEDQTRFTAKRRPTLITQ